MRAFLLHQPPARYNVFTKLPKTGRPNSLSQDEQRSAYGRLSHQQTT